MFYTQLRTASQEIRSTMSSRVRTHLLLIFEETGFDGAVLRDIKCRKPLEKSLLGLKYDSKNKTNFYNCMQAAILYPDYKCESFDESLIFRSEALKRVTSLSALISCFYTHLRLCSLTRCLFLSCGGRVHSKLGLTQTVNGHRTRKEVSMPQTGALITLLQA
jgi:hypothetical protein